MNIGRSVKVALAQRSKTVTWLSEQLGISRTRTSTIANSERVSLANIEKLAAIFELTASEFIALGEQDYNKE
jgi:DNA-binding Xre family transcriptional regulator